MIDGMFQAGTDSALDDQVQRPAPFKPDEPKFSFGQVAKAPFQGVASGSTKSLAFAAEITGAFGDVMGAGGFNAGGMFAAPTPEERKQQNEASRRLQELGPQYSNPAGDLFRQRAKEMMPDPTQTHAAAQVIAGVSEFATQAVGYAALGGPAGPALLAGDAALAESDKLKQEGVPLGARSAAGAVAGAVAGVSVALPVVGKTAAQTIGLVVAGGPGGFIAQNVAEKAILQAAGYDKLANQYDPLDPVGLALSSVVPAAFGAFAHGARLRAEAKTGRKSEAEQLRPQAALTAAEQARSDAYERSDANLNELRQAIKQEKNPEAKAALQEELGKQAKAAEQNRTADAARAVIARDPEAVAAARVSQTAQAVDSFRLTPDSDLAGMTRHTDAIESAHEMLARGERVDVSDLVRAAPERLPGQLAALGDGPHYRVSDLSTYTPRLYRDTSIDAATRFFPGNESQSTDLHFANDPAYALGQGTNTGVRLEFDAAGMPGQLNTAKPGARQSYDSGYAEFINRDAYPSDLTGNLRSVTVQPAAQQGPYFKRLQSSLKSEGFGAGVKDQNGSLIFTRPEVDRPAALAAGLRKAFEPLPEPRAPRAPAAEKLQEATARPAPAAPKEGAGTPEAKQSAALESQSAEIAAIDPDMMVQLEGREPMKVSELLDQVKTEAKEDAQEASFVEAAVNCLLRNE